MDIAKTAEMSLVGSILLKPDSLVDVSAIVKANDFSCGNAQTVFSLALMLWRQKEKVDSISILSQDKSLAGYLSASLSHGSTMGIKSTARTVAKFAKERRLSHGLDSILKSTLPINDRLDATLQLYQSEMLVEKKSPAIRQVLSRYNNLLAENKKRGSIGISTGFDFLDQKYILYSPCKIWVMGAFTSVGKTAIAVQKLCNLLLREDCPRIVFISAEMSEEEMISRILGNITGIYSKKIEAGNLHEWEAEKVEQAKMIIAEKPLLIYDDASELSRIENIFRKADLQGGVDIGFIDYVQNCRVSGIKKEYQEQAILAKSFQQLAKEVRCTLICLSQVSNDVGRGNTDQLEFKGAGEWAAVADVGIHLTKRDNNLKYLIKKNRHGPRHYHLFKYSKNWTSLHPLEEIGSNGKNGGLNNG